MSDSKTVPSGNQNALQGQLPVSGPGASPAALAIHRNFCNSVAGLRRELVRSIYYLRLIYDRNIYRSLGYTNIRNYAADHGGLNEAQCKAFLRLGAKLDELPTMKKALEEGSLTWRKANVIVGEADSENEEELVNLAKGLTEAALKKTQPKPTAKPEANPEAKPKAKPKARPLQPIPSLPTQNNPSVFSASEPCYVAFKFTPEQYSIWAAFNARKGKLTKEEALVEAMTSRPSDDGAAGRGFLIVIQECPACGRGRFTNNRGTFEAPKALLEAAHCDGTIQDTDARRRRVIPPRLKRQVLQRDGHHCQAEGCPNTQHLQLHHRLPVAQGGQTKLENLVTLCARCHRALHEKESILRKVNKDPMG